MTPEKQTHAKGRHPGLMPGNLEEKKDACIWVSAMNLFFDLIVVDYLILLTECKWGSCRIPSILKQWIPNLLPSGILLDRLIITSYQV